LLLKGRLRVGGGEDLTGKKGVSVTLADQRPDYVQEKEGRRENIEKNNLVHSVLGERI